MDQFENSRDYRGVTVNGPLGCIYFSFFDFQIDLVRSVMQLKYIDHKPWLNCYDLMQSGACVHILYDIVAC